jgi:hypothetical protein
MRSFSLTFAVLLSAVSLPAPAQTMNTGTFLGTVRDESGSAIAGATVRVERVVLPLLREVTSDQQGAYLAQDIPPGEYRLTFSANGFDSVARTGIEISSGQSIRVDTTLRVGSITNTVNVDAKVSAVETSSPNVGNTIYGEQVQELALNTRSFTQFLTFQPGARTQWSSVTTSVGSATLGQVTTARNPRYTQLAARIVF